MRTVHVPAKRWTKTRGLTMVELLVIITLIIICGVGLLLRPGRAWRNGPRIRCCNNLKQVGDSFFFFSADHTNLFPTTLTTNYGGGREWARAVFRHHLGVSNELPGPTVLACPADRERKPATDWLSLHNDNVSYFVSLDANETQPQSILAGDRNLTIDGAPVKPGVVILTSNTVLGYTAEAHNGRGNVLLADGSVQQVTPSRLCAIMRDSGLTNRIAIP